MELLVLLHPAIMPRANSATARAVQDRFIESPSPLDPVGRAGFRPRRAFQWNGASVWIEMPRMPCALTAKHGETSPGAGTLFIPSIITQLAQTGKEGIRRNQPPL